MKIISTKPFVRELPSNARNTEGLLSRGVINLSAPGLLKTFFSNPIEMYYTEEEGVITLYLRRTTGSYSVRVINEP